MSASSIISGKGGRLLVVSPSTCFTDAGATTNAVVGDAVTSVSGGGMYLQAPTGNKPYLRQASGVYYLEFGVDAYLLHTTVGVTYNADHARGIVMSSSSTSYPHFWTTYNPAHGVDKDAVSALTYYAGSLVAIWRNYDGSDVHDLWAAPVAGINGMTALRRGTLSALRVNGAQTSTATFTPASTYYPSHVRLGASAAEGMNVYAVWDVPTTLSDAEALEIENDLGTQAGAAWASSGASATITATTTTPAFSGSAQVSPEASITVTTASPSFSGGASTGSAEATVTATTASPAFSGSATGDVSQGVLTLPVLKNNTGTILANETGATVHVYAVSTGNKVVTKTAQTTNGSGIMSVTDALIVAATQYRVVVVLGSGAEGLDKVTAA